MAFRPDTMAHSWPSCKKLRTWHVLLGKNSLEDSKYLPEGLGTPHRAISEWKENWNSHERFISVHTGWMQKRKKKKKDLTTNLHIWIHHEVHTIQIKVTHLTLKLMLDTVETVKCYPLHLFLKKTKVEGQEMERKTLKHVCTIFGILMRLFFECDWWL